MGLPRAVIPGRVYMVTRRCLERRFFLRPDREMTQAFAYCLAAAARRTNVGVICSSVQVNHHHSLIVDTDGRLPEFLEHLHKFVARRAGFRAKPRREFSAARAAARMR